MSEKRIGIFGGTFDPIHLGHLRIAEEVRESFQLDSILFIPAARPPHKPDEPVLPGEHRLRMVRLATEDNPYFQVLDMEFRRKGPSYSVDTLRVLRQRLFPGSRLFFILGMDAFLEIHTWRSYERLFELADWIVVSRPGTGRWGRRAIPEGLRGLFVFKRGLRAYMHPSGHLLFFRRFSWLDISGREIRQRLRAGRSIKYLVSPPVEGYILENGLYRAVQGENG